MKEIAPFLHSLGYSEHIDQLPFQPNPLPQNLLPVTSYDFPTPAGKEMGEKLLLNGKVAALILAGGQGSRLGGTQPKALTPITPIRQKTLLQFFCEKGAAASKAFHTSLPIAIMTSSANHAIIENYLTEHNYFGVTNLSLFQQTNAPLLTDDRRWLLGPSGEVIMGPSGNGEALQLLCQSGIAKAWRDQGIEYVMVLPIDNPLADPFDATLCGYHAITKSAVTIKTILRTDPTEHVGVIVQKDGKIAVQEYSELPPHFEAPLAHIGLFCFSLSFIEQIQNVPLPWHFAHKKHQNQMIWKPEKFLFDVLPLAQKVSVVVYPRENTYAPLKNSSGDKSIATVQKALLDFDRRLLSEHIQVPLPDYFELDPRAYYLATRLSELELTELLVLR